MGAVFSAKFDIEFVNGESKEEATKRLKEYVNGELSYLEWVEIDTFENLMAKFLAKEQGMYDTEIETPLKQHHSSCFNASYGWEIILCNVIDLIKPLATKDSEFYYNLW